MTRALAIDLARHEIRVNAIAPGYFDTEITHDLLNGPNADKVKRIIPQRRFGERNVDRQQDIAFMAHKQVVWLFIKEHQLG